MRKRTQAAQTNPRLLVWLLVLSAFCTGLLHRYVFAVYVIEGTSMSPTLRDGDRALVNMFVRMSGAFERSEIVLVQDGFREYATKRIVGLPGERVEIKDTKVFINGRPLREPYLPKYARTISRRASFVLNTNQYFVLGDNRGDSYDSRIYGPVPRTAIVGSYSRAIWACR